MTTKYEQGSAGDKEARDLLARTLATESAQAAGFGLALPFAEGFAGRLVVFASAEDPQAVMRARFVRVQWIGIDAGPVVLCPELAPGELLVLVDWSDAATDDVLLLTHKQVSETWDNPVLPGGWDPHEWKFGGWCQASPRRWRDLVIGTESAVIG